jgi:predicted site-specific integrase-resolvase
MEPLLVTRHEAAKMLAISVDTLDRLRHAGKLKPIFIKSRVYYSVAALRAFVTKEGYCAQ